MKFIQLIFRFLCVAVAIFQFGILVNNAFLEIDTFETTNVEFSDSDFGDSDLENSEEEVPVLSFFCDNFFVCNDWNFLFDSKKIKIHFPSRKLVSHTQSVPFSPPELEV